MEALQSTFDIAISYYQGKLDEVNHQLETPNEWDTKEDWIEDMTLIGCKLSYEAAIRTLTQTKEGTLVDVQRAKATKECPMP